MVVDIALGIVLAVVVLFCIYFALVFWRVTLSIVGTAAFIGFLWVLHILK